MNALVQLAGFRACAAVFLFSVLFGSPYPKSLCQPDGVLDEDVVESRVDTEAPVAVLVHRVVYLEGRRIHAHIGVNAAWARQFEA